MLSIGELSKLCRISTKTLRHYDRIGLIKPVYVNAENGYRYYDLRQVRDITFINKMKLYDFTLSEISYLMSAPLASEIQRALIQKRKELQKNLIGMQYSLKQLEKEIEHFEGSYEMMSNVYPVTVVERKPCHIVSVRRYMGIKDFDKAFTDLFAVIDKNKYSISGAPLAIYHSEDYDPDHTEIETCFPIQETSGENVREFEGSICCTTTFIGPYIDFSSAYIAIETWIKENQYQITAPPFEVYVKGIDSGLPPDEYVTEIYFPVKK